MRKVTCDYERLKGDGKAGPFTFHVYLGWLCNCVDSLMLEQNVTSFNLFSKEFLLLLGLSDRFHVFCTGVHSAT